MYMYLESTQRDTAVLQHLKSGVLVGCVSQCIRVLHLIEPLNPFHLRLL